MSSSNTVIAKNRSSVIVSRITVTFVGKLSPAHSLDSKLRYFPEEEKANIATSVYISVVSKMCSLNTEWRAVGLRFGDAS